MWIAHAHVGSHGSQWKMQSRWMEEMEHLEMQEMDARVSPPQHRQPLIIKDKITPPILTQPRIQAIIVKHWLAP